MAWIDSIADAVAYKLKAFTNLEFFLSLVVIALLVIIIVQNKEFFLALIGKSKHKNNTPRTQNTNNVNNQTIINNAGRDITNILNEVEKLSIRIEYIEENIKSILHKINDDSNFHREKIPELLLEIAKLTSEAKNITKEIENIRNRLVSIDDNVKSINTKRDVSF